MKIGPNSGFTLIELMITVVIVSILAAVAYPSYRDNVRKTRRSDAKIALVQAAAMQERHYTENNSYANDVDDIGGDGSDNLVSAEGYYTITVANPSCGSTVFSCFTLTATTAGLQSDDTDCATLSLTHIGVKSAKKSDNSTNDQCW